jgi:hypothetical protein
MAVAARGGFKLGTAILIISVFTGSIMATRSLAYSYSLKAPIIEEISLNSIYSITRETGKEGGCGVKVAHLNSGGEYVTVLGPGNVTLFLSLIGEGKPRDLEDGEALVSKDLGSAVNGEVILVQDIPLTYVGKINSVGYFIVMNRKTLEGLSNEGEVFNFNEAPEHFEEGLEIAPGAVTLIKGLSGEIQMAIDVTSYLLYSCLGLACMLQTLYISREGEETFTVLSALNAKGLRVVCSLLVLSVMVGLAGAGLGYSLGMVSSSSISLLASRLFHIPYLKPSFNMDLLRDLGLSVGASSLGLVVGLLRGYRDATMG